MVFLVVVCVPTVFSEAAMASFELENALEWHLADDGSDLAGAGTFIITIAWDNIFILGEMRLSQECMIDEKRLLFALSIRVYLLESRTACMLCVIRWDESLYHNI